MPYVFRIPNTVPAACIVTPNVHVEQCYQALLMNTYPLARGEGLQRRPRLTLPILLHPLNAPVLPGDACMGQL